MSPNTNKAEKKLPATILHIFPSFDFGGQQARFAALASGIAHEFSHDVVALDGRYNAQKLVSNSAPVNYHEFQLGKGGASGISNFMAFKQLFKKHNPDLLCTYNWGSIEAVLSNKFTSGIPHIHFEDGFGPEETPNQQLPRRVNTRRLLLKSAQIVVPSILLENSALEQWKIKPHKLHRIQNGIDFQSFQRPHSNVDAPITIGSVGALRPEKNYTRLINCFTLTNTQGRARLRIVGEGPERPLLHTAIHTENQQDYISLPGATTEPATAYLEFDIFALSSDTEQAPLTLMEAMATGLPVIATDVGDIKSMVSPANREFIVPPEENETYAKALKTLVEDPRLRATLGAANRQKAQTEFDLKPMLDAYRSLFTKTMSSSR